MLGTRESFDKACRWILARPDSEWVIWHGVIGLPRLSGGRSLYCHAWLEHRGDNTVRDFGLPAGGVAVNADTYYRALLTKEARDADTGYLLTAREYSELVAYGRSLGPFGDLCLMPFRRLDS